MNRRYIIIAASSILAISAVFLFYRMIVKPLDLKSTAGININTDEKSLLLERAKKALDAGDLLKAKGLYQRAVENFPNSDDILNIQEALENTNVKLLFSPIITPDSVHYEIQKGDTLTRIAKKFNTTVELITKANNLTKTTIVVGRKLKISKALFGIVVDRSQNILTLKADGNIVKTYRVSTGKNSCTPTGTLKITNKVIDPPWYPSGGGVIAAGDPRNILGSRWLGLSKAGYGIHGTTLPESIGKSVTDGCIRLKNSDVEELYAIVSEGTEVVIVE